MTDRLRMSARVDCLERLLTMTCSPGEATVGLAAFEWDSDELVQLGRCHLRKALRGYLAGEYAASEVARWAEVIEGRDDIGFEPTHEKLLKGVIFELASPELEGTLTGDRARQLLSMMD